MINRTLFHLLFMSGNKIVVCPHYLDGITYRNRIVGNILRHNCARTNHDTISNMSVGKNNCSLTHKNVVTDDYSTDFADAQGNLRTGIMR